MKLKGGEQVSRIYLKKVEAEILLSSAKAGMECDIDNACERGVQVPPFVGKNKKEVRAVWLPLIRKLRKAAGRKER